MIHGNVDAGGRKQPNGRVTSCVVLSVLGAADASYMVPWSRVEHMPRDLRNTERPVLCPAYDPNSGIDACRMGHSCRLVHADVSGLQRLSSHVNFAWRSLGDVAYTRHPPGQLAHVAAPNSRSDVDVMDSGYLLMTKALDSTRRPLTHCAHYYYNRQCNLGSECRFVHAIFVDPSARPRQRAPAPIQLGRRMAQRNRGEILDNRSPPSDCDSAGEYGSMVRARSSRGTPQAPPSADFSMSRSISSPPESPHVRRWKHEPYAAGGPIEAG